MGLPGLLLSLIGVGARPTRAQAGFIRSLVVEGGIAYAN